MTLLPAGTYQPVIRITSDHRTITLPNTIEIDRTPPELSRFPKQVYTHISPDGDHRNDVFRIPYVLNGPAHAMLLVDNRQAIFTRSQKPRGTLTWNGTVDGKKLRPGQLPAPDLRAGCGRATARSRSRSRWSRSGTSRSAASAIDVAPRHRFALFVLTRRQEHRAGSSTGAAASSARTRSGCAPRASRAATASTSRRRAYGQGDRERRMTAEAARLGGVVGALGLSVLLVAPARRWRVAGLVGLGGRLRAARRLRSRRRATTASTRRPAVVGLVAAAAIGLALRPLPVDCCRSPSSRARRRGFPVHVGSTKANLLLPLYAVVAGAAVALAVELLAPAWVVHVRAGGCSRRAAATGRGAGARGAARPRAAVAGDLRLAGRALHRVVGDRPPLVGGPAPGRDLPPLLPPPARARRGGDRAAAVAVGWVKVLYAQLAAMAVAFAVIGIGST